jgi:predicted secreted hydrolase
VFSSGTWIGRDGTTTPIADGEMTAQSVATAEVAGRNVPIEWRLTDPARGLDVTVTALNPNAWNPSIYPYWEGPVVVTGSHAGRGYLEMTGYD